MNNKEIIENVSEQVAKDWDIKEHVWKKGNLWWQKAIEKALVFKDKEIDDLVNFRDKGIDWLIKEKFEKKLKEFEEELKADLNVNFGEMQIINRIFAKHKEVKE